MKSKLFRAATLVAVLLMVFSTVGLAAVPPHPTYGDALVDGSLDSWRELDPSDPNYRDVDEWNTTVLDDWTDLSEQERSEYDFFAHMVQTGGSGGVSDRILADLFLRYDCGSGSLFLLVLTRDEAEISDSDSAEEVWAKIDGSKVVHGGTGNDGTAPDFSWVLNASDTKIGWEGSTAFLNQGTYTIDVHSNVWYDDEFQTAATGNTELEIDCGWTPTAVELAAFTATAASNAIEVSWNTASELDNLGFNVLRATAADGVQVKLNDSLIAAQALGSAAGASYSFVDATALPGVTYFYWLESVDIQGGSTLSSPVSASLPALTRLRLARPRLAPLGNLLQAR